MKPTLALSCFAIAGLLLALAPRYDSVAFHPTEGSSLAKSFKLELEFELDEMTMIVDGNDMSGNIPADMAGAVELEMSITDQYLAIQDGRPTDLIRSYDELSSNWEATAGGEDAPGGAIENFDALASKRVRFKWNEEKGEYEVAFHESDGDADLLQSLDADMDLRALLPSKEVSEGDTWEVSGSRLGPLLFCGSRLDAARIPDDNPVAQLLEDEILPQLEKLGQDFKLVCLYKGTRDEAGTRVGVIDLKLAGEGTIDLRSFIEAAMELERGDSEDFAANIEVAAVTVKLDGTGECLWDLAGGHLRAFSLDSELACTGNVDLSIDVEGQSHSAEAEAVVLGRIRWGADQAD